MNKDGYWNSVEKANNSSKGGTERNSFEFYKLNLKYHVKIYHFTRD